MAVYWTGPDPNNLSSGTVLPDDMTGRTEITQEEFVAAEAAFTLAREATAAALKASSKSDTLDEATAAYLEIVGIHPIAALSLARLIHPGFEAP